MNDAPLQTLAAVLDDARVKAILPVDALIDAGNALRATATELNDLRKFKANAEGGGERERVDQ